MNRGRALVIGGAGILGCLFIWWAAPYNNFVLRNSYISDTFLPVAAIVYLLLLVFVLNPLLRGLHAAWVLDSRALLLVFCVLLAAAVVPSQGLLRMLPHSLAKATQDAGMLPDVEALHREMQLPPALFPDPVGHGEPTPVSDRFLDELMPGESLPWAAWLPPALAFGVLMLFSWLLMIAVGMIFYPHWRDSERLPFPLLTVKQLLVEGVDGRSLVPTIFKDRLFWCGAGLVMFLYALNGLHHHTNGMVPSFPLGWDLRGVFSEQPWRNMPSWAKQVPHLYFVLIGMAYFMPNRVGLSIWATQLVYAWIVMIGITYFPPFHTQILSDHRSGAMLGVSLMVLFLARGRLVAVARGMGRVSATDEARRDEVAAWMLVVGAAGVLGWFMWTGVGFGWSAMFVGIGFLVSVLICRVVAETGLPFMRITGMNAHYLMSLLPASWSTPMALFMSGFTRIIFQYGSRISAAVMAMHIMGLDRENSPKRQVRLAVLVLAVLLVGFVVCGAIHVHMGYRYAGSLDGVQVPLAQWGATRLVEHQALAGRLMNGVTWGAYGYPAAGHFLFGLLLAVALQWGCLTSPRWPVHPIGLLMVGHFYGANGWASVLIGWSFKVLLVRYGGSSTYKRLGSLFFGLILGEIFAAITWTVVPVVLIWLGNDPASVGHISVLPT